MQFDGLTMCIIGALVLAVIVCNIIERKLRSERERRFWRRDEDEVGI